MEINNALAHVTSVVRAYKGTADEHELLAQSLDSIYQYCKYAIASKAAEVDQLKSVAEEPSLESLHNVI